MNKKLLNGLLLFLLITASGQVKSQVSKIEKGAHQLYAEEMKYEESVSYSKKNNENSYEAIISLSESKNTSNLSKVVMGFLTDGEYNYRDAHKHMQYDLLSHVAVFDFKVQKNGSLDAPRNWPWTDVINGAHSAGAKVIMTVTNFDLEGADGDEDLSVIMKNTSQRSALFWNIKKTISDSKIDGVNIDFEAFKPEDRGDVINDFLFELSTYLHNSNPDLEISFSGPAVNWSGWDFASMVDAVDYLFIMAYDYNKNKSAIADAVSPLYAYDDNYPRYVDDTVVNDYAAAVNKSPEKVILGVPYYGVKWKTTSSNINSTIIKGSFEQWGVTKDFLSTRYKDDIVNMTAKGRLFDDKSRTPWYRWQENSSWYQVYTDDAESLGEKYDYAISKNLGGIGIWALNFDGERTELWDLIDEKFSECIVYSGGNYCGVKGRKSDVEYLNYVRVGLDGDTGVLAHRSGDDSGYYDYSADETLNWIVNGGDLVKVLTYKSNLSTVKPNVYYKVWVDYNKNNIFDDVENVIDYSGVSGGWNYEKFTAREDVFTGDYRLRIIKSTSEITSPCGCFAEGEAEDYTLKIVNDSYLSDEINNSGFELNVYPNPTKSSIKINSIQGNKQINIYNIVGVNVYYNVTVNDNVQVDMSTFKSGIYFVEVIINDAKQVVKVIKE
ncbi:MAG: T9SS type A sorting domain-containing protein [Ichthyobacteriaceae bacterium]|nr:T9SS type A sorting domain-containing protein [Ichthyobacteriaceae bacterium]